VGGESHFSEGGIGEEESESMQIFYRTERTPKKKGRNTSGGATIKPIVIRKRDP